MIDYPAGVQTSFKLATATWQNCSTQYVSNNTALIYLPKDYYTSGDKTYPTIMFCHGVGEKGDNVEILRNQGLPKVLQSGPVYGKDKQGNKVEFIVISIQNETWSASPGQNSTGLQCLINQGLRVDTNRVYVTGLSAGGQNSHGTMEDYPRIFAACISMSPANAVSDQEVSIYEDHYIWFIQGTSDTTVSPGNAYTSVDKINKLYPGHARLTKFNGGHCCWPTYYSPEWRDVDGLSIYDWLLQYSFDIDSLASTTTTTSTTLKPSTTTTTTTTIPVYTTTTTTVEPTKLVQPTGIITGGEKFGPGVVTLTLPDNSITLDGSGSTGTIDNYVWGILGSSPSHAATTVKKGDKMEVTDLKEGTYIFFLTVESAQVGWPSSDKLTVYVKPNDKVIKTVTVEFKDDSNISYDNVESISLKLSDGSTKQV